MKYDIVALGEILIDFIPDGYDDSGDVRFIRKAGGAPLNLLATAAKFGRKTAFIGKVGNDIFGRFLAGTLQKNGIDDCCLAVDNEHNTTMAFVELSEDGDRSFSFCRRFGADVFLTRNDISPEILRNTRLFHFGSLSFTAEPLADAAGYALQLARDAGCIITYDPNYRPLLWESESEAVACMRENLRLADIAKLSRDEALMITETADIKSAVKQIKEYGVAIVLITDGANGVTYSMDKIFGFIPSLQVKPVDTTGAGDIFFGTFLSMLLSTDAALSGLTSEQLANCVKYAVEISGKSTLKHGAISSIPKAGSVNV